MGMELIKVTETNSTVTLGWTPTADVGGYVLYANNQVVSVATKNLKDGTPRREAKFSKTNPGPPFEVVALTRAGIGEYAADGDSYPDPVPPPPVPIGTPIEKFADVKSNSWGQPFVNRWFTTGNAYEPPPSSGNWPSINAEAIEEISTPHGPGFRFRVHTEMDAFSAGAKAVMLHDQNHYIPHSGFLGRTHEIRFKIMFPSVGNVVPWYNPGYDDFNALMEMIGDSNVSNQIGINAQGRFYCRSYGHTGSGKAVGPPIALDTWYEHRWIKKWSYGSDGLTQWYVDDVKHADWLGASLQPNTKINSFQWGYYSYPPPTLTEIHYAGMRFIET